MRDRLIEILKTPHKADWLRQRGYDIGQYEEDCVEAMTADLLLASGGIVLPCKVGDTLYVLSQMRDKRILPFISEYEATSITIGKRKCIVYHEMDGFIKSFKQDDFGKTVFLTREEAEKVLKENN